MHVRTVGIVGYGNFGALADTLLGRFAPRIEVKVHAPEKRPDGKRFFSLAETAKCDVVILAVPIHAFEDVLKKALPFMRKDTVIVDIATVKVHTVNVLRRLAKGRRYVAAHPVWGPESYEKRSGDVRGFRIVIAEHTLSEAEGERLFAIFRALGFDIVRTSAEEHDKHLAETLFLTHFIGQLVARGGFERTEVDTVSFGFLMDAVESVRHDKKLFRDVFRFNPYCRGVLDRFEKAESEVRELLESSGRENAKEGVRIGISGVKGSFSEEAARAYAKKAKVGKFELDYLVSVENVLAALEERRIDIGIFPLQNSIGGIVTEAVRPMSKYRYRIRKVFDIDIRQNLIVKKGVDAKSIKTIRSHEQALRQCRGYLRKNWPKAKQLKYEDTAKAAEDLAKGKLPKTTAVIASRTAAEVYKLKVLEAGIQDLKTNFTTFIAAVR